MITNMNKALLHVPLVKDDKTSTDSAPLLFGPNFPKRSKDYMKKVRAMRSTLPSKQVGSGRLFIWGGGRLQWQIRKRRSPKQVYGEPEPVSQPTKEPASQPKELKINISCVKVCCETS